MHGTGLFITLSTLAGGGTVVLIDRMGLDAPLIWSEVERNAVQILTIVGDVFARPLLAALDAEPDRWDLSSLFVFTSSGVMFSEASKQGLIRHQPHAMIVDAFSSSEAVGMGQSVSAAGADAGTAKFSLGAHTKVFTEDLREVEPGSGEIGRVAVGGHQPIGYYKDPEKTAATFLEVDGKRYSIPGDFATVEADGSITLLGRGSVCINTGGEKVFPEEVEEVLKTHGAVRDAVAVGVPDEKFGEAITAVVELAPDTELDEAAIIAHVKGKLASYKAPKRVLAVDTIGRAPNGKVDYKRLKQFAQDELGIDA
jgi:fatty-acyl-CoA synthase